jgi:hypothetical protein
MIPGNAMPPLDCSCRSDPFIGLKFAAVSTQALVCVNDVFAYGIGWALPHLVAADAAKDQDRRRFRLTEPCRAFGPSGRDGSVGLDATAMVDFHSSAIFRSTSWRFSRSTDRLRLSRRRIIALADVEYAT